MRELLLWLLLTQPLHNTTLFYEERKMPMTTSRQGKTMIKDFEGFRERPYRDGDIFLIGYGHRILPQEKNLKVCSEDKAEQLFEGDIEQVEQCIDQLIPYPLTQNQYDALVSFIYSAGCGAFRTSSVYRHLKGKEFGTALQFWNKWTYNGVGISLRGLVERRKKETALFGA
jgi:lysozyme